MDNLGIGIHLKGKPQTVVGFTWNITRFPWNKKKHVSLNTSLSFGWILSEVEKICQDPNVLKCSQVISGERCFVFLFWGKSLQYDHLGQWHLFIAADAGASCRMSLLFLWRKHNHKDLDLVAQWFTSLPKEPSGQHGASIPELQTYSRTRC